MTVDSQAPFLDPRQSDNGGILSQLTVLPVVSTLQRFSEEFGKQC